MAPPSISRKDIIVDVTTTCASLRLEFCVVLFFAFNFDFSEAQFVVWEIKNAGLFVLLVVSLLVDVNVTAGDVVDPEGDVSVEVDEAELQDLNQFFASL